MTASVQSWGTTEFQICGGKSFPKIGVYSCLPRRSLGVGGFIRGYDFLITYLTLRVGE